MLSHAANIAVPIWRGTYCFLQSFFLCMCSLSVPPLSSSSCRCCCPHALLPHCPLHMPSPTSGIFIAHKVNLMEKCVWKRAVKPGTGADGGEGGDAWPVPSSPGVPCDPNYSDLGQWRQGRAESFPLGSSSSCINPPLVKLMLHHKTPPAGRQVSLSH